MKWRAMLTAILFGLALAPGAGSAGDSQPLPVVVSILPQKYFVEKIGGDAVTVSVMVPPVPTRSITSRSPGRCPSSQGPGSISPWVFPSKRRG